MNLGRTRPFRSPFPQLPLRTSRAALVLSLLALGLLALVAGSGAAAQSTQGVIVYSGADYRIHGSQITNQTTRIDRYPARISPDGTKIVLIRQTTGRNSQIQVLNVASGQFSTLAPDLDRQATEGTVEYLWPRFDPQGRI